jgi:hypothetical protein
MKAVERINEAESAIMLRLEHLDQFNDNHDPESEQLHIALDALRDLRKVVTPKE